MLKELLKNCFNSLFYKNYIKLINLKNDLYQYKSNIYDLTSEINLIKSNFELKLNNNKINNDINLKEKINNRFNLLYSEYLDKIKFFKEKIEKSQIDYEYILNQSPDLIKILNKEDNQHYKDFIYKKYMKFNLGYNRNQLPQIDKYNLNSFLTFINCNIEEIEVPINKIKPTQNKIDEEKFLNIFFSKIKGESKNFPYIVSKDFYLLDGHHNWASDLEEDENKKIKIFKLNLNIEDLIKKSKELNILTKQSLEKDSKIIIIDNDDFIKAKTIIELSTDYNNKKEEHLNYINNFSKYIDLDKKGVNKLVWKFEKSE